jgi:hypothetical protein
VANYRAIETVCEAIIHLLRTNSQSKDFGNDLQFKIYLTNDFADPMNAGVSLFLYRVFVNGNHRIAAGGRRYQTQLPLDLHFLLTVWAQDSSTQHQIAGWMMRVMEDTPILPLGLLNTKGEGVFRPDETVEISPGELRTEDMLHLWEILAPNKYQLSVPYLARNIRIESDQLQTVGEPIQQRTFDYRKLEHWSLAGGDE